VCKSQQGYSPPVGEKVAAAIGGEHRAARRHPYTERCNGMESAGSWPAMFGGSPNNLSLPSLPDQIVRQNLEARSSRRAAENGTRAACAPKANATAYSRSFESMMIVTGPSLSKRTCISAPNSPVWTGCPRPSLSLRINAW
jgi:hypothetical protein